MIDIQKILWKISNYYTVILFMLCLIVILASGQAYITILFTLFAIFFLYQMSKTDLYDLIVKDFFLKKKYDQVHSIKQLQKNNTPQYDEIQNQVFQSSYNYPRKHLIRNYNEQNDLSISRRVSDLNSSSSQNKRKRIDGYPIDSLLNTIPTASLNISTRSKLGVQSGFKYIPRQYLQQNYEEDTKYQQLQAEYYGTAQQLQLNPDKLYLKLASIKRRFLKYFQQKNRDQIQSISLFVEKVHQYFQVRIQEPKEMQDKLLRIAENYRIDFSCQLSKNDGEQYSKELLSNAINKIFKYIKSGPQMSPWRYKKPQQKNNVYQFMQKWVSSREQLDLFLKDLNQNRLQQKERLESFIFSESLQQRLLKQVANQRQTNIYLDIQENEQSRSLRFLLNFLVQFIEKHTKNKKIQIHEFKSSIFSILQIYAEIFDKKYEGFLFYLREGYQRGKPHYNLKYQNNVGVQYNVSCIPGINNFYCLVYFYFLLLISKYDKQIKNSPELKLVINDIIPVESL